VTGSRVEILRRGLQRWADLAAGWLLHQTLTYHDYSLLKNPLACTYVGYHRTMSEDDNKQYCLFCRMIGGEEAATIVFSDQDVVGLVPPERDARVHVLLIPRKHIASVDAMAVEDRQLWWHLLEAAQQVARLQGIDIEDEGYHLVTNAGRHSRRAYPHLHVHLASGALE